MIKRAMFAFPVVVLAAAAGSAAAPPAAVSKAVAVLQPLGGSGVSGSVTFTRVEAGVKVEARVSGLKQGAHGFHVHEFGDCSAADGTSAGPHFNPGAEPHAGPQDAQRHTGDMGNITVAADGDGVLQYVDPRASFEGANSILGRGVIVHANADDMKTQPTGNAGGRIACGVIGVVKGQ